jgi:simple sugar transport system ATP-binding protein
MTDQPPTAPVVPSKPNQTAPNTLGAPLGRGADAAARTSLEGGHPGRAAGDRAAVVAVREISKRFGPTQALDTVSLRVEAGEIHAILGENGAGKSTLLTILAGMIRPDSGQIVIDGTPVSIDDPAAALRRGIATVYQHFSLVPTLSIVENVELGQPGRFALDLAASARRLAPILAEVGLEVSPWTEVLHLSVGARQRVEIAKALHRGARVLLLDEPTSVLAPSEVDTLFAVLRRVRERGTAIVLVTHKLAEVFAVSDRVSVLRRGRLVGELPAGALDAAERAQSERQIVAWMFGERRSAAAPAARSPVPIAEQRPMPRPSGALLSLRAITATDDRGAEAVRGVSLDLWPGEIVGIAGVDGNGQKQLAEVIAGQRPAMSGTVVAGDQEITNRGVAATLRAGVGYVTDDRLGEGVVPGASIAEHLALKAVARRPLRRGFWFDRTAIERQARALVATFDVRTPSVTARATDLSGGNLQKLLLAREIALDPRVLVCKEPTAGLDQQTAHAILTMLRERAERGLAVLLLSTELDDLLAACDRIGVMVAGRLVAVVPRAEATADLIGRLMLGGETQAPA